MSKYVIFSFDDGRLDQYTNGYRILKKYNYPATINIVSEYINGKVKIASFGEKSVLWNQLNEMQNEGLWEIACHGATHKNTVEDIERWLSDSEISTYLKDGVGFASPSSILTYDNFGDVYKMVENGKLLYIRSGKQTRREGIIYSIKTLINRKAHNVWLFYNLNKDCILKGRERIIKAIGIVNTNTPKEIMHLINKMQDGEAVILMLHSISDYRSKDIWTWDIDKLEKLCNDISKEKDVVVCTTKEWWKMNV